MPIYTNLKVVDKNTGNTIISIDENGFKDGSNRSFQASKSVEGRLTATPLAAYMWTCFEGIWRVTAVNAKVSVTGGAACTVDVLVSPGVVAPAGTTQLTAPIDIEEAAPFSRNGTLITTPTTIYPGDSLSRVIGGTPASLEGLLTVHLVRVS